MKCQNLAYIILSTIILNIIVSCNSKGTSRTNYTIFSNDVLSSLSRLRRITDSVFVYIGAGARAAVKDAIRETLTTVHFVETFTLYRFVVSDISITVRKFGLHGIISTAVRKFGLRVFRRYRPCVWNALSYLLPDGGSQRRWHRITDLPMLIEYRAVETKRVPESLGPRAFSHAHNSSLNWM